MLKRAIVIFLAAAVLLIVPWEYRDHTAAGYALIFWPTSHYRVRLDAVRYAAQLLAAGVVGLLVFRLRRL